LRRSLGWTRVSIWWGILLLVNWNRWKVVSPILLRKWSGRRKRRKN
jgi:hypothetical protein